MFHVATLSVERTNNNRRENNKWEKMFHPPTGKTSVFAQVLGGEMLTAKNSCYFAIGHVNTEVEYSNKALLKQILLGKMQILFYLVPLE
ncbi:hypothetical protein CEXT_373671 [Caerostris extrusa]|uniref:Uncharacterized protein n=1 Tax=Caerostris extrusa TaxID=172846 RepID=A0AAV4NAL9_CAEEX|nr:hypothetical protein CEXT_373671 [Caerostris extrusa]